MSATKAGPAVWSYWDDFYQAELLWSSDTDGSWEMFEALRDFKLEKDIAKFEQWQYDEKEFFDDEDDES